MAETQVVLTEAGLGALELGTYPYVVTGVQIGSPAVRTVSRPRALADGTLDETRFLGPRAVTVSVRLHNGVPPSGECGVDSPVHTMQSLVDRVVPYMSPRIRPRLVYSMPGSEQMRSMVVRGESWPVAWDRPKYPTLPLQFVCPSGEIVADDGAGGGELCTLITPASDVELGRAYDLPHNRVYPPTSPIGGRTVNNVGNAPAHWTLTMWGDVTNPSFTINSIPIEFERNGGLVLTSGSSVVIDSRERTVLLNGDPTASRYDRVNYNEWGWDQLRLVPGPNTVRFSGTNLGLTATAQFCYRPTYLA